MDLLEQPGPAAGKSVQTIDLGKSPVRISMNAEMDEQGTSLSGFESLGPYHCEDCIHQNNSICFHPIVMIDPQLEERRLPDGRVPVDGEVECCKYVNQRKGDIYIVRHGDTDFNEGHGDGERFRAWGDPPLNDDGLEAAAEAAEELIELGIEQVVTSDLQRASRTAQIIADRIGAEVVEEFGFRPWDLGDLAGELIEPNLDTVKFHQFNSDVPLPGGESYDDFTSRWDEAFARHAKGKKVFVTHTRNINHLFDRVQGTRPDFKNRVDTGGIVRAQISGKKIKLVNQDPIGGSTAGS